MSLLNNEFEEMLDLLAVRQPLTHKAVYPRNLNNIPIGYLSPKYYALTLWSQYMVGFDAEMRMLPHITGVVNCLVQMEYRVPTYFIRSEFAQAVAHTKTPVDFKLSDIKWPLDAMLFVLPTDFVLKQFGFLSPFISVTRAKAGVYPDMLKHLPKCDMPSSRINKLDNQVDRMNMVYNVYGKSGVPVDYTGSYPLTMSVGELADAPFEDATYMEEQRLGLDIETFRAEQIAAGLPEGEAEKIFNAKVQAFTIKLMLALTAMPKLVTEGTLRRPLKFKNGKQVQSELWNPNYVGWEYRAARPENNGGGQGTHASPRWHWRSGHMRKQPSGPRPWTKQSPTEAIWLEPVIVNAPPDLKS